ncbi:MAG: hypothetical protein LLF89_02210, partial [Spirochaetaceae bacterium]|nr:hypothetical protein [Spirochaetaceae bacterium]
MVLRPDASGIFARVREAGLLLKDYKSQPEKLSIRYRSEALQLDHGALLSVLDLADSQWLKRFDEALELFREYGKRADSLSMQYKKEGFCLDYETLYSKWKSSKESWWARRKTLERSVRKTLQGVAEMRGDSEPDYEKDLAILSAMKEIQNQLESFEILGDEATSILLGRLDVPPAKYIAFQEILYHAISRINEVKNAPVTLTGLFERLFGTALPQKIPPANAPFGTNQADINSSVRNRVVKNLLEVSEDGGGIIPDCANDLNTLAKMRRLRERLNSFDDLPSKTAGLWSGINTDLEEVRLAAAFYDSLKTAIAHFVDMPETMVALQNALEYLLGSGNASLGIGGGVREAMEAYLVNLESFRTKCDVLSRLAECSCTDWLEGSLSNLVEMCNGIVVHEADIFDWCAWLRVKGDACAEGLTPVVDSLISGAVEPDKISEAFEVNYCRWWLNAVVEDLPVMRSFVAIQHEKTIKDFQRLAEELRDLSRMCIRTRICSGKNGNENEEAKERGILRREMEKKKRHMPLRQLISAIPSVLTKLSPCLLMSPLSIAQYLTPG